MNVDQSLASPRQWFWPFDRVDWVAAGLVWLASQTTYFLTTQPNVGLLDSGEC